MYRDTCCAVLGPVLQGLVDSHCNCFKLCPGLDQGVMSVNSDVCCLHRVILLGQTTGNASTVTRTTSSVHQYNAVFILNLTQGGSEGAVQGTALPSSWRFSNVCFLLLGILCWQETTNEDQRGSIEVGRARKMNVMMSTLLHLGPTTFITVAFVLYS